mmetsp:Transcript_36582/g.44155  ORF Transcript_36582/g.44155 Transcript_36582/m.44155 type:complete len:89 (-) Transcript_36582:8-274(-)
MRSSDGDAFSTRAESREGSDDAAVDVDDNSDTRPLSCGEGLICVGVVCANDLILLYERVVCLAVADSVISYKSKPLSDHKSLQQKIWY